MPFAPEPTTADFYKLLQDYSDLNTELAVKRVRRAKFIHWAKR